MVTLFEQAEFECRVSSVLNKDHRSYGKKHMFDNLPETCWNSDAGTPQWVMITFEKECTLSKFEIEFQGGFAGKNCHVETGENDRDHAIVSDSFYPEDNNSLQSFKLQTPRKAKVFKFFFNESTDLFGRIIIYKMSLYS